MAAGLRTKSQSAHRNPGTGSTTRAPRQARAAPSRARPACRPCRAPSPLYSSRNHPSPEPANLESVMGRQPHRRRRAQVDECVAVAGPGIFPVAFVGNVVGIEPKSYAPLLAARRVARAEIEEIVAGHAHHIIARSLLASGRSEERRV